MPKIFFLCTAFFILAGCAVGSTATAGNPTDANVLNLVATTGMIANLAENIGGEHVTVHALMGPGVDPHLYVASEGDVELLQNADIIFYNGLFLEAQMDDILKQLGERKTVIPVAEHIDPSQLLPWVAYPDEFDPHVWFDVQLWMKAAEAVRNTLVEVDAANADTYRTNADAFLAELSELDAYVREQAERVPAEQRVLITAHDAFHYFGRAYGFEVRGLQGISTASEAGTADVRDLADFIVERQIPAIFVESSVPVRNVEALQAAVKDRGFDVVIGGSLFSDAMGDPGTPEGTYIGMVRHNIDTIVGSLLED
jgi:manganese/zinc/iron transport system substrate-binding protein